MRWGRLTRLFFLAISATAVGCVGDIPPSPGTGSSQPDASTAVPDGAGNPTSDAGPTDAPGFACRDQVPSNQLTSGHHNAGQDCMNGCHNHGFTLAGTLFTSAAGGTAIAGGTITVVDATGKSFDVVSQQNGNFYTSTAVQFPVTLTASECPAVQAMTAGVPSGQGGCNRTGCHTATGGAGRIHLP
jgi:hypothetical protein